jgi:anti-sigma factor RsiW
MKCRYSENDIALYVEGDLDRVNARKIETHVMSCDKCREIVEDLRESQSAFKSLRLDTVSAAALSYVRTRVLAEVAEGNAHRSWGRWVYAIAGFAFALVILVAIMRHAQKPAATEQQVTRNNALPAVASESVLPQVSVPAAEVQKPRVVSHVRRNATVPPYRDGQAETETQPDTPKQIVVKLLTDDPNIVIYWLVDQKTGGSL